jgi:hypothetical protein
MQLGVTLRAESEPVESWVDLMKEECRRPLATGGPDQAGSLSAPDSTDARRGLNVDQSAIVMTMIFAMMTGHEWMTRP